MDKNDLKGHLPGAIHETSFEGLGRLRRGKVRDIYEGPGGLYLVATDRVSAFDSVIATIPFKGFILTSVARFWFDRTTQIVRNHIIDIPHPNVMLVKKLEPIEVEMVVRAYITGVTSTSLWTLYSQGKRVVSGNRLPEGMKKNEKLPQPIITPSTKAAIGRHDETVSPEDLVGAGVVSEATYKRLARVSLDLFDFGSKWCERQGLILVDTKYELGMDEKGEITLMDEIHTPDSSRIWDAATYEECFAAGKDPLEFDKEYIRKWLRGAGYSGEGPVPPVPDDVRIEAALKYIDAYERITGVSFRPPYESGVQSLAAWAADRLQK